MNQPSSGQRVQPRVGVVGVYAGGADVELVRQTRAVAGHVTVSGTAGRRAITALAKAGDLYGVDLDPATYCDLKPAPQLAMFGLDWEAWQRDQGLPVVRSAGRHVGSGDVTALAEAFSMPVGTATVRVVSLHSGWLRREGLLPRLLGWVRRCDDMLAFVLADVFDPLGDVGAVDGLRGVLDAAGEGGRRVELLRSDLTAVGFAVTGGSLATIGLGTSTRHHGLPMNRQTAEKYRERQCSPYALVRALLSWQKGTALGALAPFGGAGITECDCPACGGASLLRFDRQWPGQVPADVRAEARAHDLHTAVGFAEEILNGPAPARAWVHACRAAMTTADAIAEAHRVELSVPNSITGWI